MAKVKRMTDSPGRKTAVAQQPSLRGDFHAWLLNQAASLRDRRHDRIDWESIAEELEAMARSEEHGLESFFEVLLHAPSEMGLSSRAQVRKLGGFDRKFPRSDK